MSELLYRCPRCEQALPWTDGVEGGPDVQPEYWCQHCGEESLLWDCAVVAEGLRGES